MKGDDPRIVPKTDRDIALSLHDISVLNHETWHAMSLQNDRVCRRLFTQYPLAQ